MRDEDREYLRLLRAVNDNLTTLNQTLWSWQPLHVVIDAPAPPALTATTAVLNLGGSGTMADTYTVDDTGKTLTLSYTDDKGDPVATPPADAAPVFASDNPAVLTIAPSAGSAFVGDYTFLTEGTANVSVSGVGSKADGTPIADPAPQLITVTAGAAVAAALTSS